MGSATEDTENTEKNRVMLLTPAGVGGIAVIRLRGDGVESFLSKHFSKRVVEGKCVYGELRDGESVIDDAVVVRAGDFVDLNLHGGIWVVRAAMELAKRAGFAETTDAVGMVDGGTVIEKEVMAALPLARTELAIRALLAQREAWKDSQPDLGDRSLWWLLHPPGVAIVGVANVGKSTLANQLFGRERSITADVLGTTRDWVGEYANIDGLMVMLVDTPGVRGTLDEIEREAIEVSQEEVSGADLVVVVLDPTQAKDEQVELARKYADRIVVANKKDREAKWDVAGYFKGAIGMVATLGEGVGELRREIRRRFGCESMDFKRARWWTERQRRELATRGI